jgi:hypothetical protein
MIRRVLCFEDVDGPTIDIDQSNELVRVPGTFVARLDFISLQSRWSSEGSGPGGCIAGAGLPGSRTGGAGAGGASIEQRSRPSVFRKRIY